MAAPPAPERLALPNAVCPKLKETDPVSEAEPVAAAVTVAVSTVVALATMLAGSATAVTFVEEVLGLVLLPAHALARLLTSMDPRPDAWSYPGPALYP